MGYESAVQGISDDVSSLADNATANGVANGGTNEPRGGGDLTVVKWELRKLEIGMNSPTGIEFPYGD